MLQKIKQFLSRKWVVRTGSFLLAWIIIHIIYITADGLHDYNGNAAIAIIFGNHVYCDGRLSPWLKGRVDKALQLYKDGRVKKIFASGGKDNGSMAEGDAMKIYLLQHGVPEQDVIADNLGQNTFLTAQNFKAWNNDFHYDSIIVVSQFYHITRIKYIMHKLGFKNVYSASSTQYSIKDVVGTLREVPAFYKYLLVY